MAWRVDEFAQSLTAAAPATVAAYRRDVEAFTAWAERSGLADPEAVDRRLLRRYLAALTTRQRAPRTIARTASSLRRYFGWLRHTGVISADPTTRLSAPKGAARLPHVLRADELHVLLDDPPKRIEADSVAIRDRDDAVLELLYGSGLRVSELCGLGAGDVDLDRRRVVVWGKGSKQRQVPLSAPAIAGPPPLARRPAVELATSPAAWSPRGPVADEAAGSLFLNRRGRARSRRATSGASSTAGRRCPPTRTPCATASRPTCSTGAPTCGRCRSCWATPTSRPRSYTLTSAENGCGASSMRPIREPRRAGER